VKTAATILKAFDENETWNAMQLSYVTGTAKAEHSGNDNKVVQISNVYFKTI